MAFVRQSQHLRVPVSLGTPHTNLAGRSKSATRDCWKCERADLRNVEEELPLSAHALALASVLTMDPGSITSQPTAVVYVSNAESQDISVLELGQTGDLNLVQIIAVPGSEVRGDSLPLVVSPDRRLLFAALRGQPHSVGSFSIDIATGRLRLLGTAPLADSMAYMTTDRRGRFLLAASYQGDKVTVSPIGAAGSVGAVVDGVSATPKAHCVLAAPSNQHVLHTSLGGDRIHQHRFDPETGQLTPNHPPYASVHSNSGPRHLVFSTDGRFVYVINELDAGIDVFKFDAAAGTLGGRTRVGSALPKGFAGTPWAADLHLTPDGHFLYASERTTSTLVAFKVDCDSGRLTLIGSHPTAEQPRAFAMDPTGRYLLAAGQRSNTVRVHAIDPTVGALTPLKDHPVGRNPGWIEVIALPRVAR